MKREFFHILLIIITITFSGQKAFAQKTDTIIHINNNVMTGELKKIIYGVVSWKMDGMGTIDMEEVKVNTIISRKQFEIKLKNGIVHFGSFDSSSVYRKVNIVSEDKRELVNVSDIVQAYPIKKNLWLRITADFSLGINYSKGSDVATVAISGDIDYRKKNSYYKVAWDVNNTFQADTLSASKSDLILSWQQIIAKNWSSMVSFGPSQNLELGNKLRWDINLLGIRDIFYNDWNRLYVGGGINLTQETPYDDSGVTDDVAGLFTMVWKVYKYTDPKIWVDADVSFIPYITDSGRYRTSFNLNPKISVFSDDFKVGFKFYYTYDSQPASDGSSTDDYGINLQLTYSLH